MSSTATSRTVGTYQTRCSDCPSRRSATAALSATVTTPLVRKCCAPTTVTGGRAPVDGRCTQWLPPASRKHVVAPVAAGVAVTTRSTSLRVSPGSSAGPSPPVQSGLHRAGGSWAGPYGQGQVGQQAGCRREQHDVRGAGGRTERGPCRCARTAAASPARPSVAPSRSWRSSSAWDRTTSTRTPRWSRTRATARAPSVRGFSGSSARSCGCPPLSTARTVPTTRTSSAHSSADAQRGSCRRDPAVLRSPAGGDVRDLVVLVRTEGGGRAHRAPAVATGAVAGAGRDRASAVSSAATSSACCAPAEPLP